MGVGHVQEPPVGQGLGPDGTGVDQVPPLGHGFGPDGTGVGSGPGSVVPHQPGIISQISPTPQSEASTHELWQPPSCNLAAPSRIRSQSLG